jgi:cell filamentation protein
MSSDPYVYPGTTVLKNIPRIRNQEILDRFEADRVGQRSLELIECPLFGLYDIEHLQGIHRYLFQDVYEWAGEFRTVDIAKGNSYFAHVPYIESTLKDLFERLSKEQHLRGLNQERLASRVAEVLGTLNAVHAFREGNGRTQREFVRELAYKNSYWIDWNKVAREELYQASLRVEENLACCRPSLAVSAVSSFVPV